MKTMKNEAFFSSKNIFRVVFISLMLIVFNINLIAQTEFSKNIVDTTKQWNVVTHCMGAGAFTDSYRITSEDTIVDGKTYNRVQQSTAYDTILQEWYNWINSNDWIREDSSKVYIYTNNTFSAEYSDYYTGEYLLFDFSLSTDDSVYLYREDYIDGDWIHGGKFYIIDVDSVKIEGINCKKIYLSQERNGNIDFDVYETWIEGVGSSTGFLESASYMSECGREMLCVKQGDIVLYSSDYSANCYLDYGLSNIDKLDIRIYPTLAKDLITIESNAYPINISIINLNGNLLKNIQIYNSDNIDISVLPSGLYTIVINNLYSTKFIKM